jgi:hypothetical protein
MSIASTIVNSSGGQWLDHSRRSQLQARSWKDASFYVNLLNNYGPRSPRTSSLNEILSMRRARKCKHLSGRNYRGVVHHGLQAFQSSRQSFLHPRAMDDDDAGLRQALDLGHPACTTQSGGSRGLCAMGDLPALHPLGRKDEWLGCNALQGTQKYPFDAGFFSDAGFALSKRLAIDSAKSVDNTFPKSPCGCMQFDAIPKFQYIGPPSASKSAWH